MAAVVLGLVVAVLLGEIAARTAGGEVEQFIDLVGRTTADLPVLRPSADPERIYELIPSTDVWLPTAEAMLGEAEVPHADDPRHMVINSFGFRDREWVVEKAPSAVRVLCFGGSNTYGAGVSEGRGWPSQLQDVLHERGLDHVEVWNLGIDAYMTRQKIRIAERALEEWSPDLFIFQLTNLGPRLVLDPMKANASEWLAAEALPPDGGLYREYLVGFPGEDNPLRHLVWRSALARRVLIAGNRIQRGNQGAWVPHTLAYRAEERAGRGFARLVDAARPSTEVFLFVPPVGGRPFWTRKLDLPVLDTTGMEEPPLPDFVLIHPGAKVYRWYAEHLADALIAGGCLTRREGGVMRCEGLKTTFVPEGG